MQAGGRWQRKSGDPQRRETRRGHLVYRCCIFHGRHFDIIQSAAVTNDTNGDLSFPISCARRPAWIRPYDASLWWSHYFLSWWLSPTFLARDPLKGSSIRTRPLIISCVKFLYSDCFTGMVLRGLKKLNYILFFIFHILSPWIHPWVGNHCVNDKVCTFLWDRTFRKPLLLLKNIGCKMW